MADSENFKKIVDYVDLIRRKPKSDVKFFYFDEGRKFIVDGNRLKLLPMEYSKYYTKDEFYVHVNIDQKKVMFYAYDVESYITGKHSNEEEGFFEWDRVESQIHNFLVLSIKELCDSVTPYNEVREPRGATSQSSSPYKSGHSPPPISSYSNMHTPAHTRHNYTATPSSYTTYGYGSAAAKERDAFFDKLNASLKNNHTSFAMDQIKNHFDSMCEAKKFEELDYLIKSITFDKLNIPAMIGILEATKSNVEVLKERKDFFNKVKFHISKIKPSRVDSLLKGLETGVDPKV